MLSLLSPLSLLLLAPLSLLSPLSLSLMSPLSLSLLSLLSALSLLLLLLSPPSLSSLSLLSLSLRSLSLLSVSVLLLLSPLSRVHPTAVGVDDDVWWRRTGTRLTDHTSKGAGVQPGVRDRPRAGDRAAPPEWRVCLQPPRPPRLRF